MQTPIYVNTTIIDTNFDLRIRPAGLEVDPLPSKAVQTGSLGLTRVAWPLTPGHGHYVISYARLTDAEVSRLLVTTKDRTDGAPRFVSFNPGGDRYSTQHFSIEISLKDDVWSADVSFIGKRVPL